MIIGLVHVKTDPSYAKESAAHKPFYTWIQTHTDPNAVFAMSDNPNIFRLIARRAVFYSNDFPFREDFFEEFYARKVLMKAYQNKEDLRQMSYSDFQTAAKKYPLHYAVFKKETPLQGTFPPPVYEDTDYKIYKVL